MTHSATKVIDYAIVACLDRGPATPGEIGERLGLTSRLVFGRLQALMADRKVRRTKSFKWCIDEASD